MARQTIAQLWRHNRMPSKSHMKSHVLKSATSQLLCNPAKNLYDTGDASVRGHPVTGSKIGIKSQVPSGPLEKKILGAQQKN